MRLLALFLTILLFSGSSLAECRNKDCMTAQFELETMGHTFHYDEVFNIGTNWYIIFDYPENNTNKTITFEFYNGVSNWFYRLLSFREITFSTYPLIWGY